MSSLKKLLNASIEEAKKNEPKTFNLNDFLDAIKNVKIQWRILLELIVVLGVALIIAFTTITAGKQVNKNAIKFQLSSEAMMLEKTIGDLFVKGDYTGISPALLIISRALPRSMILNETLVHADDGWIDIQPASPYGQASKGYKIIFNNLESYACNYLVNNIADMFLAVSINGTFVKPINGTLAIPSVITNTCSLGGNAVAFVGL